MSAESQRWDSELAQKATPAPLLQTWAWGEVQSQAGWTVERLHLPSGSIASVQIRKVGPTSEVYVPRGPVAVSPQAIDDLVTWSRKLGAARIVVEPEVTKGIRTELKERGFARVAPTQPQHTRIVKLLPPDELLKSFRHGRRYNIRTGIKRGVVVDEGSDAGELARQSAAVERRESIHLPDRRYYKLLLDMLPWCRTYTARSGTGGEALATVLVARHDGRAYSLFAGRSGAHRELMGNDLAWWTAIKAAAEAGCADFDLWGIPPPNSGPQHPWHGLGFFKSEFGGEEVAYVGAWELVLSAAAARWLQFDSGARAVIRRLKRNIP